MPVLSLAFAPAALLAAETKAEAEGVPLKGAAAPKLPETAGVGEAEGELLPDGAPLPDGLAAALLRALLLTAGGDAEGEAARAARAAGHSLSPSTALCPAEPLATITRAQKPAHLSMNG
jgi:hypothetical protein